MTDHSLYVVTSLFNPRQFASRYKLYNEFRERMLHAGVKLVTVELAFSDRAAFLSPYRGSENEVVISLRSSAELWHKERLLNLGIQRLLQAFPFAQNIAVIDADVTFTRPDWVQATVDALDHYHVVQPFGEASNLDPQGHQMWKCPSAMRRYCDRGFHQEPPVPLWELASGHPGLAWAFRRAALDSLGGLLDVCIAGSADMHMANALMGDVQLTMRPGASPAFLAALQRWQARAYRSVRGNVGYVPGTISHHWHGNSGQRGYEKRFDIMAFHQFDPATDIVPDAQGVWQFAGNKPRLADDIRRSLSDRNEDSVDVLR
jgi:hypothetical protein